MPASPKLAWRWIVGTTAAAMLFLAALPSVGRADTLTICVTAKGKIKGINVPCPGTSTSLSWETVGPQGDQGPDGVDGPPGHAGPQGAAGVPGIQGPNGAQGAFGPTGDSGVAGGIGDQGPQGIQGNPGIQGIPGLKGIQGIPGINGGSETNKTFLTGGTLADLGADRDMDLTHHRVVNSKLIMGPGNGADTTVNSEVPMNDPGNAYNLFVNVDHHPGINPVGGPISYIFKLCNAGPGGGFSGCTLGCTITDPDTTCSDTTFTPVGPAGDFVHYAQGDLMGLFAWTDDSTAASADVTWSLTYDHTSLTPPLP